MLNRISVKVLLSVLFSACIQCGYQTARPDPVHNIRKLKVEQVQNETTVSSLGFQVTAEMKRCINSSGSPDLVSSSDEGSPVLMVRIVTAEQDVASVRVENNERLVPGDNTLEITAEARIRNRNGQDIWGPAYFSSQMHWLEKSLPLESTASEQRAVSNVSHEIGTRICRAITGI